MCSTVITACDCPEALLASSVPLHTKFLSINTDINILKLVTHSCATHNLQLNDLAIQLNSADFLQIAQQNELVMVPLLLWSQIYCNPTYKIHTNGADVALSVSIILQGKDNPQMNGYKQISGRDTVYIPRNAAASKTCRHQSHRSAEAAKFTMTVSGVL